MRSPTITATKLEARHARAEVQRDSKQCSIKVRARTQVDRALEVARLQTKKRQSITMAKYLHSVERLEDAAKRRHHHLEQMKERCASHLHAVVTAKERVQAAKSIQVWARSCRRLDGVADALKPVVEMNEMIETGSFADAMELLQKKDTTEKAINALSLIPKSRSISSRSKMLRSSRVFLMSAVLTYHAREVIDYPDENVAKLLVKVAMQLVQAIKELQEDPTRKNVAKFDAARLCYMDVFGDWKRQDGTRIANAMLERYAQIFAANYHTIRKMENETAANDDGIRQVVSGTQKQLAQIQAAVARTLGKAEALVRVELIEVTIREQLESKYQQDLKEEEQSQAQERSRRKGVVDQKPDLAFTRSVFSNDQLAHELIMDPSYRIEKPSQDGEIAEGTGATELIRKMQTTIKTAFWDSIAADVKSREYGSLLGVFDEIQGHMKGLMGSTSTANEVINPLSRAAVEAAIIKEGDVVWPQVLELLLFTLKNIMMLEAPARTGSTQAYVAKMTSEQFGPDESIRDAFEFLFEKLEEIRLDAMNAQLNMLAPFLRRNGVDHERKKFQEKMEIGEVGLDASKAWIAAAVTEFIGSNEEVKFALVRRDAKTTHECLRFALVYIVKSYIDICALGQAAWPETLAMDAERVKDIRDTCDSVALRATLIAIVRQTLAKTSVRVQFTDANAIALKNKISVLLADQSIKMEDVVAECVRDASVIVESAGKTLSKEDATVLGGQLRNVLAPDNPVFKFFSGKVFLSVQQFANDGEWAESAWGNGLGLFEEELRKMGVKALKLWRHNEAVHADRYSSLIAAAVL